MFPARTNALDRARDKFLENGHCSSFLTRTLFIFPDENGKQTVAAKTRYQIGPHWLLQVSPTFLDFLKELISVSAIEVLAASAMVAKVDRVDKEERLNRKGSIQPSSSPGCSRSTEPRTVEADIEVAHRPEPDVPSSNREACQKRDNLHCVSPREPRQKKGPGRPSPQPITKIASEYKLKRGLHQDIR